MGRAARLTSAKASSSSVSGGGASCLALLLLESRAPSCCEPRGGDSDRRALRCKPVRGRSDEPPLARLSIEPVADTSSEAGGGAAAVGEPPTPGDVTGSEEGEVE